MYPLEILYGKAGHDIIEITGGISLLQTVLQTPMGPVSVLIEEGRAIEIRLGGTFEGVPRADVEPFLTQLKGYFEGRIKWVDFPVKISSTPFLMRVWKEVRKIPYGTVVTYGSLAKKLKTSPRAIGMAMAKNPLPIYIPCHRVVAKSGLGGFGPGLEWKRFLLELEGAAL